MKDTPIDRLTKLLGGVELRLKQQKVQLDNITDKLNKLLEEKDEKETYL